MKRFISFFRGIVKRIKVSVYKIYHARGSVHEIALGVAIGAFWGVFPTFGLSTVLTLLLYKVIRFNVIVAISAAFISNPLTSPFWLISAYEVGNFLLKSEAEFSLDTWKEDLPRIGSTLILGSMVVSSATAVIIYYMTRYFVGRRRVKLTSSQKGVLQNKYVP
jgi:uncharacterized protein